MKKTLIALMALAGVALGANELNVPVGGNFCGGDYAFSFTVTADLLSSTNTSDVLAAYWGNYNGHGGYNVNAYVLSTNEGAITLSVGDGTMANWGAGDTITADTVFTEQRGASFTPYLNVGETYSIICDGSDGNQTVRLYEGSLVYDTDGWYQWTEADGEAVKQAAVVLDTVVYNGNMNGSAPQMSSVGNAAYKVQVLPEPTTATLSLLALAGLAARRRRK